MEATEAERLLAVAAHDLKEPLRTSRGFLELLADRLHARGEEDPLVLEATATALGSLDRLQALLDDVLLYARAGGHPIEPVPTDPGLALDAALRHVDRLVKDSGAQVRRSELPLVMAAYAPLALVLQNLVANAVKYRSPSAPPAIQVRAEAGPGPNVRILVEDNGRGLDPAWAHRLFQPFARFHTDVPGTGLGLATCRRLMEAMGGGIEAVPTRSPLGGAAFALTFPRAP